MGAKTESELVVEIKVRPEIVANAMSRKTKLFPSKDLFS